MQRKYLAIDLRGYPSALFEKVCQVARVEDFPRSKTELQGVEITTSFQLKKIPKGADIVFARGGSVQKNRKFLNSQKIDVLSCPHPFDSVCARRSAENKIAVELCFKEVAAPTGYLRARVLTHLYKTVRMAKKYHCPLVLTSGATCAEEVVSPRQLVAFGKVLGLDYAEAKASVYTIPKKVLEGFE